MVTVTLFLWGLSLCILELPSEILTVQQIENEVIIVNGNIKKKNSAYFYKVKATINNTNFTWPLSRSPSSDTLPVTVHTIPSTKATVRGVEMLGVGVYVYSPLVETARFSNGFTSLQSHKQCLSSFTFIYANPSDFLFFISAILVLG